MKRLFSLCIICLSLFLTDCKRQVTRVSSDEQIDVSGRWNDTDSRLVAEEMVSDCLNRPWRTNFETKNDKKPIIIVGIIQNKSHEHISAETFIKDIERGLLNSGTVRIVENAEFREKLREEKADQAQYASPETQKQFGKELGADYMMFGTINSIVDQYKKEQVVYYQVDLELADLTTNEKVWIGNKKIKKFVKR